jgi:hypothetical protein
MRVKSIVDVRSKLFVYTVIGAMTAFAVYMTQSLRLSPTEALFGFLTVLLASGLLLWLLFGTYYELREHYLLCKSGPFVERIPYDSITRLVMSENMFSSLALSPHRIEILQYDEGSTGSIMISPQSRELFLARLKQRCAYLERIA